MKNQQPIPEAYQLAKDTAEIILPVQGIKGVLLFGSTLWSNLDQKFEKEPRDIDLVLIHEVEALWQIQYLMTYNEEQGMAEIDLKKKLEKDRNPSLNVIDALDSVSLENITNEVERIRRRYNALGEEKEAYAEEILRKYKSAGINQEDILELEDTLWESGLLSFTTKLEKASRENLIYEKVKRILSPQSLGINQTLDILVLGESLLKERSEHLSKQRQNLIQQCNNPNFWYNIISSGRLYDPAKKDFSVPIQEKYPGSLELFKQ